MKLLRHDQQRKPLREGFILAALTMALGLGGQWAGEAFGEFGGLGAIYLSLCFIAWAVLSPPSHVGAERFVFFALWLEQPAFNPGAGYWVSPLNTPNIAMFSRMTDLHLKFVSVPFALVLALLLWRKSRGPARELWPLPGFRIARAGYLVLLAGTCWTTLVGYMRGEPSWKDGYTQLLPLVTGAIEGLALLSALGAGASLTVLGTFLVLVAALRSGLAAWVYFVVCGPQWITPEYATHHADSVTFVAALGLLACALVERRSKQDFWRLAIFGLVIMAGIVFNNRRAAYAAGGFGALTAFILMSNSATKKALIRYVLVGVPALLVYFDVGKTNGAAFFKPAKLVWSMFDQRDSSTASRDIENMNLAATVADFPLFGTGFGYPYKEHVSSFDVSEFLANYQYYPHNTVLGLLQYGGIIGFTLMWWPHMVQGLMAARAHRAAADVNAKAAALWAAWCLGVTMTLDWGDMGISMQPCLIISAVAIWCSARTVEFGR